MSALTSSADEVSSDGPDPDEPDDPAPIHMPPPGRDDIVVDGPTGRPNGWIETVADFIDWISNDRPWF